MLPKELLKLVPAPRHPLEIGSLEQWNAIERALGLSLPADYKEFAFSYGTGLFARFYRVYNPFSASPWMRLLPSVERVCGALRAFKMDWPDQVPHRIYPEAAGLLPWGNDENGNDYYWLTDGPPDAWRVFSDENRGEGLRGHDVPMGQFLTEVLLGKREALAGGYPTSEDFVFSPFKE